MTHTAAIRRTSQTASAQGNVEGMLRDMAFVLSLTRRVRDEILSEQPLRVINNRVSALPSATDN